MLRNYLAAGFFLLCATFFLQQSVAGPLTSAEVTKIINRVAVIDPAAGEHPAIIREVIKDDLGLQTGEKSRSELLFQDNTLTRLGAETFFSFKTGTRDMTLEKGSMLLQVPKGLGGAKIHTAAVTAAITGTTIMMEYIPGKYIKVLVLEGSLRLSRNGTFGDSLVLRPGKMVIMKPDAKKIPEPVDVDLKKIVKTSTLVNFPDSAPLPSMGLIQAAIDVQNSSIAKGNLAPTNLVMGHGTDVILASNDQLARIGAPGAADVNGNASPVVRAPTISGTNNGGALPATIVSLPAADPVTAATTLLPASAPLTDNTTSVVATVTGSTTTLLYPLTSDTTSVVGSLTSSTTSLVGTVATNTTALLGPLTAPVTPLLGLATDTTASLLAPITGSTAPLPSLGSVVATTTSVLSSVTQATTPLLSSVTGSVPVTGAVTAATMTQTATSPMVSVSSSTQLLTLLSKTTPSAGSGTVVVSPKTVSSGRIARAPTASSPSAPVSSNPTGSLITTLTSAPTILATAPVSSTGITKPLRVGLGH